MASSTGSSSSSPPPWSPSSPTLQSHTPLPPTTERREPYYSPTLPLAFPALTLESPPPAEVPLLSTSALSPQGPKIKPTVRTGKEIDQDDYIDYSKQHNKEEGITTTFSKDVEDSSSLPQSFSAYSHGGGAVSASHRESSSTLSPIETLPLELIEQIAFQLCRYTNRTGPPSALLSLLLTSRRFYDVLGPRNEGFYADLFKERFDWRSVERRFAAMKSIEDRREKKLLLEQITAENKHQQAALLHSPALHPAFSTAESLFRSQGSEGPPNGGMHSGLHRPAVANPSPHRRYLLQQEARERGLPVDPLYLNEGYLGGLGYGLIQPLPQKESEQNASSWRPLKSRDWALEFKRRCTLLTRMRMAALSGMIPPSSSRPSSPKLQPVSIPGGGVGVDRQPPMMKSILGEPDELTQDLWTTFLMLIENDGKNLRHLLDYGQLRMYMRLFYKHSLLSEALSPGWPRQTVGRALGLWIGWLGGDDLSSETSVESLERFFVLKPYVFGAHNFDAFHAPWTISSLPVTPKAFPVQPRPTDPFLADLRPNTQAQTIVHMGRKIEMTPPILSQAAIFSFFFRVEQDPANAPDLIQIGPEMGDGVFQTDRNHAPEINPPGGVGQYQHHHLGGTAAIAHGGGGFGHAAAAGHGMSLFSRPAKTSLPILNSRIHDRDFARLASCIDPYSSRGLPTLHCRRQLAGSWEGRFSFFDFDSYRDMLGGRMKSLYEGPFGDQPQVWKIEEKIVRLRKNEKQGGKGPVLNAGFELGASGPPMTGFSSISGGTGGSGASGRVGSPPRRGRRSSPENGSSNPVNANQRANSVTSPSGRRQSMSHYGNEGHRFSPDRNIVSEGSTIFEDMDELGAGSTGGNRSGKRSRSQERTTSGTSAASTSAYREYGSYSSWDDEWVDENEDGDYEILLTGSGHSAWGQFILKGRIRSYDGMFSITKEYTPDSRGRWLYRGYCVGQNLVGRWRDTHTPVDMNGYEGTFLMNRRT